MVTLGVAVEGLLDFSLIASFRLLGESVDVLALRLTESSSNSLSGPSSWYLKMLFKTKNF